MIFNSAEAVLNDDGFRARLAAYIRRTHSPGQVEDVLQDVALHLLERWPKFTEHHHGYIFRVATNFVVSRLRYDSCRRKLSASEIADQFAAPSASNDWWRQISPLDRIIGYGVRAAGLSTQSVAKLFGLRERAVWEALKRLRSREACDSDGELYCFVQERDRGHVIAAPSWNKALEMAPENWIWAFSSELDERTSDGDSNQNSARAEAAPGVAQFSGGRTDAQRAAIDVAQGGRPMRPFDWARDAPRDGLVDRMVKGGGDLPIVRSVGARLEYPPQRDGFLSFAFGQECGDQENRAPRSDAAGTGEASTPVPRPHHLWGSVPCACGGSEVTQMRQAAEATLGILGKLPEIYDPQMARVASHGAKVLELLESLTDADVTALRPHVLRHPHLQSILSTYIDAAGNILPQYRHPSVPGAVAQAEPPSALGCFGRSCNADWSDKGLPCVTGCAFGPTHIKFQDGVFRPLGEPVDGIEYSVVGGEPTRHVGVPRMDFKAGAVQKHGEANMLVSGECVALMKFYSRFGIPPGPTFEHNRGIYALIAIAIADARLKLAPPPSAVPNVPAFPQPPSMPAMAGGPPVPSMPSVPAVPSMPAPPQPLPVTPAQAPAGPSFADLDRAWPDSNKPGQPAPPTPAPQSTPPQPGNDPESALTSWLVDGGFVTSTTVNGVIERSARDGDSPTKRLSKIRQLAKNRGLLHEDGTPRFKTWQEWVRASINDTAALPEAMKAAGFRAALKELKTEQAVLAQVTGYPSAVDTGGVPYDNVAPKVPQTQAQQPTPTQPSAPQPTVPPMPQPTAWPTAIAAGPTLAAEPTHFPHAHEEAPQEALASDAEAQMAFVEYATVMGEKLLAVGEMLCQAMSAMRSSLQALTATSFQTDHPCAHGRNSGEPVPAAANSVPNPSQPPMPPSHTPLRRGPGRPRKNSMEPSAPPESPKKRGRGRPPGSSRGRKAARR